MGLGLVGGRGGGVRIEYRPRVECFRIRAWELLWFRNLGCCEFRFRGFGGFT